MDKETHTNQVIINTFFVITAQKYELNMIVDKVFMQRYNDMHYETRVKL